RPRNERTWAKIGVTRAASERRNRFTIGRLHQNSRVILTTHPSQLRPKRSGNGIVLPSLGVGATVQIHQIRYFLAVCAERNFTALPNVATSLSLVNASDESAWNSSWVGGCSFAVESSLRSRNLVRLVRPSWSKLTAARGPYKRPVGAVRNVP